MSTGHAVGWEFFTGFLCPQSWMSSQVTSLSFYILVFFSHLPAPNHKLSNILSILCLFFSPVGHMEHTGLVLLCVRARIQMVHDNGLFRFRLFSIRCENILSSSPVFLLLYPFLLLDFSYCRNPAGRCWHWRRRASEVHTCPGFLNDVALPQLQNYKAEAEEP